MDYARLCLLQHLGKHDVPCSVANDLSDLDRWLGRSQLLVTYVAGPFPDDEQSAFIEDWLSSGRRWLALHGTSDGKTPLIFHRVWEGKEFRQLLDNTIDWAAA